MKLERVPNVVSFHERWRLWWTLYYVTKILNIRILGKIFPKQFDWLDLNCMRLRFLWSTSHAFIPKIQACSFYVWNILGRCNVAYLWKDRFVKHSSVNFINYINQLVHRMIQRSIFTPSWRDRFSEHSDVTLHFQDWVNRRKYLQNFSWNMAWADVTLHFLQILWKELYLRACILVGTNISYIQLKMQRCSFTLLGVKLICITS